MMMELFLAAEREWMTRSFLFQSSAADAVAAGRTEGC